MINHRKLVENPGSFIEIGDTFEAVQKKCADIRCIDAVAYFAIDADEYRQAAAKMPATSYGQMLSHALRDAARTADHIKTKGEKR